MVGSVTDTRLQSGFEHVSIESIETLFTVAIVSIAMWPFNSNEAAHRIEPLVCDGHRVLCRYDDPDEDGTRLVWVKDSAFGQIDEDEITE